MKSPIDELIENANSVYYRLDEFGQAWERIQVDRLIEVCRELKAGLDYIAAHGDLDSDEYAENILRLATKIAEGKE